MIKKLPTLKEYIKAGMGQSSTKLVLEIKYSIISETRTLELTRKCVEIVKELKAREKVDYISFSFEAMKLVLELDPEARASYISWKSDVKPKELKDSGLIGVDLNYKEYQKST